MAVDPQFGVDAYNRAKILDESRTTVNNILTILFGKPGFYPSIPRLGMDIQQYLYTFEDEIDTTYLKSKLASQCSDFMDNIADGSFDIIKTTYEGQPLLIFVIPTIISNVTNSLLLGVTITSKGEYKFNFTFNDTNVI